MAKKGYYIREFTYDDAETVESWPLDINEVYIF
jgi:hypothetical protein